MPKVQYRILVNAMKIDLSKPTKHMSFSAFTTYAWKSNVLYEKTDDGIYAYEPVFMGGWVSLSTNIDSFKDVVAGITPRRVKTVPPKAMTITVAAKGAIPMYKVNSSNVAAIGYDEPNLHLYIEYKGGKVYEYDNVTPDIWNGLVNSESRGSYVHWFLKINDNQYAYRVYNGSSLYYATSPLVPAGTAHPNGWMTNF